MTMRKVVCLGLALFALVSGATGCVHRELLAFDDHESKPLTSMRVLKNTNYLFWSSQELVFYSCAEQGDKLSCKRLCGGDTDLVCPTAVEGYGRSGSNIQ